MPRRNQMSRSRVAALIVTWIVALLMVIPALAQTRTQNLIVVGSELVSESLAGELERQGVKKSETISLEEFSSSVLADHDTIIFSQACEIGTALTPDLKKELIDWVAEGHKLIIHDADKCSGEWKPNYSFLPFNFETDNPGPQGASGDELFFVENNTLGNDVRGKPQYVDLAKWLEGEEGNNELGDSNIVKTQAKEWCGHMFGTNVESTSGFSHMYAHLGKGLVIYNGFDIDQYGSTPQYDRVVLLEVLQPFNPDNLPCAVSVAAHFLITTPPKTQTQRMAAGKTFTFPIKLYSNQGYKGNVKLSLAMSPAEPGLGGSFAPLSVPLETRATSALTVKTLPSAKLQTYSIKVTGSDASGQQNSTYVTLLGPEVQESSILVTPRPAGAGPAAKNIEIILDGSGSMKEMLGTASKIGVARRVLRNVLAKLPDDANVGLRMYGHRFSSKDPQTCTDSELVVPIQKLEREKIADIVNKMVPRGETPLVYSILKAPEDFHEQKGGTIILITDGQESCRGDTKTVGTKLKAAGVDFKLSIVGFGITQKPLQQELQSMARSTGGEYFTATNAGALSAALLQATTQKRTFVVFNLDASEAGRGVVGEALTVPPGTYRVAVLGEEPIALNGVTVNEGKQTTLKLVQTGENLELQP